MLAQVFTKVGKYNRTFYYCDATDMVAWIINVVRPKKIATSTSYLVETQLKRTMHFWEYSKIDYTKNDPNYLKKKKIQHIENKNKNN